ncbi:ABC transporter ATP-binding protein [Alphaproteobacteria bacterium]|nr:ABC transporter ATP-binding protein [Alphaproteobacteria bacterium]
MANLITLKKVNKFYKNKYHALNNVSLNIKSGEIFALLGPNGAGKTTLINSICGLSYHNSGTIKIAGLNLEKNRKAIKSMIGLVPQELHLEAFDTVFSNVCYSRGLWGLRNDYDYINDLLKKLKLFEKKDSLLIQLSGGMKRRVLIAKALSHNPKILFLDEPSAGVDVELRQEMWQIIYKLKEEGVTIILTTHYIEEAEEIADRVGFINDGKIILVEEKKKLLAKLGNKKLVLKLSKRIKKAPSFLKNYPTKLNKLGKELEINLDNKKNQAIDIIATIKKNKFQFLDFDIKKRSLESIFINFIKGNNK